MTVKSKAAKTGSEGVSLDTTGNEFSIALPSGSSATAINSNPKGQVVFGARSGAGGGTFISVSGVEKALVGGSFSGVWLDTDQDGKFDLGETALTVGIDGKLSNGTTLVDFQSGAWRAYFWDLTGPVINLEGFGIDDQATIDLKTHTNWSEHVLAGVDLDQWLTGFSPTYQTIGNANGRPYAFLYSGSNSAGVDVRKNATNAPTNANALVYKVTDFRASPSIQHVGVIATGLATNNYIFVMPDLPIA